MEFDFFIHLLFYLYIGSELLHVGLIWIFIVII